MPHFKGLFEQFNKRQHFVETGTFIGCGVKAALEAGFTNIQSCEIQPELINIALSNIRKHPKYNTTTNVKLVNKKSTDFLRSLEVKEDILFWIDSHYSGGVTGGQGLPNPLAEELKVIKEMGFKNCTLLVDDCRGSWNSLICPAKEYWNQEPKWFGDSHNDRDIGWLEI